MAVSWPNKERAAAREAKQALFYCALDFSHVGGDKMEIHGPTDKAKAEHVFNCLLAIVSGEDPETFLKKLAAKRKSLKKKAIKK